MATAIGMSLIFTGLIIGAVALFLVITKSGGPVTSDFEVNLWRKRFYKMGTIFFLLGILLIAIFLIDFFLAAAQLDSLNRIMQDIFGMIGG